MYKNPKDIYFCPIKKKIQANPGILRNKAFKNIILRQFSMNSTLKFGDFYKKKCVYARCPGKRPEIWSFFKLIG